MNVSYDRVMGSGVRQIVVYVNNQLRVIRNLPILELPPGQQTSQSNERKLVKRDTLGIHAKRVFNGFGGP